jgi:hypothetical protein
VIDALDQAEDEGAEDFLSTVAAILRAARGSGVRLLCTSRRELPIGFDETHAGTIDLIRDAPDRTSDLQRFLERSFDHLEREDRDRVVTAILRGAADNWLWAATNAQSLKADISERGSVPPTFRLTSGLEGLYQDGLRRMRSRLGADWEKRARPLLTAVASAFDEQLTVTELRWITSQTQDQIVDVARLCEPFLQQTAGGIRAFHSDFSRWILAGKVAGASEESGHLAVARGFTALGRETRWSEVASKSASRVVDHWCAVLVLDPFSPSHREHELELASVLTDPDWVKRARVGVDAIEQAALVAPALRFPGSSLPLSTGLHILTASATAQDLAWQEVTSHFSNAELIEFQALANPALEIRWLEEHLPDYASIVLRTLWSAVLRGRFFFCTRERRPQGLYHR